MMGRLVGIDGAVSYRSFRLSSNPPILHCKELLLPPGYPWVSEFASLSAALEAKGLFVDRTEF